MDHNGPKPNTHYPNRPARGLILCLIQGDVELSTKGNRLRVEKGNTGRSGGSFANESERRIDAGDETQRALGAIVVLSEKSIEAPTEMEDGEISVPSEGEVRELVAPVLLHTHLISMINCILWNCMGANKPNFRRSVRYFTTDVLAVFETHVGGNRAARICHGLDFENFFWVDAAGQSGGMWLMWRSGIWDVVIVASSDQYIYAKVTNGTKSLNLVVVYAAPSVSHRSGLWSNL